MSTLQERFELLMNGPPKVRAADLARACGIKQPSVNGWLSGKTKKLEAANALAAAEFFGVNAWWLATGLGPMKPPVGSSARHVPYRGEAGVVDEDAARWPFTADFLSYVELAPEKKKDLDAIVSAFLSGASTIKRTGTN